MQCGNFQLASSSPEQFLRLSGDHVTTRPNKGTRPRGTSPDLDARLGYELQTSAKDRAELVMITDLLRNDLGRFCEYGSVTVPDLAKLERFAQVQHLVSTCLAGYGPVSRICTRLPPVSPGGSITGAPKIPRWKSSTNSSRSPVGRTPVASATWLQPRKPVQYPHPHGGLPGRRGVVSRWRRHRGRLRPGPEYEETLNKAAGWLAALTCRRRHCPCLPQRSRPTSARDRPRHHPQHPCILLGGLAGLFIFRNISKKTQQNLKTAIAWCRS
ncbi:MAG: hypothetical protein Ct9H300mP32_1380 [Verrucomicrobiota bacterium]|nr:MAG: hypothetical protein Ct9H300mP32_1380 [Verrucomicrobiota bacterium]